MDISSNYAEVNGIRLHYLGAGTGNLVLFVHGFPEFGGSWERYLVNFGRDHETVAPDMRGYNLSSKPSEPEKYQITELIEDLRALADYLGHRRFVLVGHDWGGAVAWSFAIRYPERLEKLIIINAPHPAVFARELLRNPDQQKASQYMLTLRSAEAEKIVSANNYRWLINALSQWGSRWEMTDEIRRKYVAAWSRPGALNGALNYYRISPLYPPTSPKDKERLENVLELPLETFRVRVPTLVVWGELDWALLKGNLNGLEDYVDDLVVRRIPDGTHWVIHEKPERVASLIREFVP